ncbi:hypothetical protein CA51_48300 [Rosistilla oblonga]|uniref:Uncharacterized protein n=1 Tax=Rosistilla oblonga TaxID=2527990 RepID=A0A518IV10_9BACT|nr:hypothetical protein [Rosistilla oblonga]QDV14920.1 hypothetical protein CA51_48300 [Rosistilla oblonga]QDV56926.1 hypothetical protein Mal33_29270 [Rosistilla oblonga]
MRYEEFRFAKLTSTLLVLLAMVAGTTSVGCGPTSSPEDSAGEAEVFDEDAYAEEMAAEQKRVAKELREQ